MSAVLASLIHFNLTNLCINQNKQAIKKPSFILKKLNSLQLLFSEIYIIYVKYAPNIAYYNFCILGIQHSKSVRFPIIFFHSVFEIR